MKHSETILSECLQALREHPDAPLECADIVQDVHIAIVTSTDAIGRADKPRAYVQQIARRHARRSVRRALRAPITLDDEVLFLCRR